MIAPSAEQIRREFKDGTLQANPQLLLPRLSALLDLLASQDRALGEAQRKRDEAIELHGQHSGFWGRAAARLVFNRNLWKLRAEQAEAERARLREALTACEAVFLHSDKFPEDREPMEPWVNERRRLWDAAVVAVRKALSTPARPTEGENNR